MAKLPWHGLLFESDPCGCEVGMDPKFATLTRGLYLLLVAITGIPVGFRVTRRRLGDSFNSQHPAQLAPIGLIEELGKQFGQALHVIRPPGPSHQDRLDLADQLEAFGVTLLVALLGFTQLLPAVDICSHHEAVITR
jgi:hypothetical protein